MRAQEFVTEQQCVVEDYSNTTFNVDRRKLNVPALIQKGAIFVTYPHGEQGWETDNDEDWAYSLISLYNVLHGGWPSEAKKYLKPKSYKRAEQQINSSAPNLGSDQLVYDGKYNQILWSIKKLGIPDQVAFLDKQAVAEGQFDSMVKADQAERNAYKKFVSDRAGGDWSRGARLYAKLKNRPADDIFGDDARLQQFMRIKFDFGNFTKQDWRDFWLLSQHADKYPGFQKQALDAIEKHLGQDNDYYRYLSDRISCARTGQQKYGTQDGCEKQGVSEGLINESALFLNPNTVIVGQVHGQPLDLSPETLKRVKAIAAKHGAWYEGNGADRAFTKGVIDNYVGSFDDDVATTMANPNDPKWIYVLFANVDANNRVQRVGVDPKDTIFNRLLDTAKDNSFQGIGFTAQALKKFLAMSSEGKYDFVKMSQQPATQENLTRFLKAGEALMWPANWEQYPNKAGKIAKAATVDARDQYLASRKAGVYVVGSGHLKAIQQISGKQDVAEGVRAYHGNQGGIDTEQLHAPMWFTASRPDAEHYAGDDGYVVVVDLDITNPYVLRPGEEANTVLRRWQELQAQGYDGIYDRRLGDWIPFTREQIRVISKDDVMKENFADGKKPGRKGLAKRVGVDCSKSETELRKIAKNSTGEKQRMAHWCANMKSGKRKK